ncbi:hypothetical protein ACX93W_11875 [Paenibacillus sp. CAU 1782]
MDKKIDGIEQKEKQQYGTSDTAAFRDHPGFRRMFAPDKLTMGIFLPMNDSIIAAYIWLLH